MSLKPVQLMAHYSATARIVTVWMSEIPTITLWSTAAINLACFVAIVLQMAGHVLNAMIYSWFYAESFGYRGRRLQRMCSSQNFSQPDTESSFTISLFWPAGVAAASES